MRRHPTTWILIVAIGLVTLLFLACDQKKPKQEENQSFVGSPEVYIVYKDSTHRLLVTDVVCGEAGSPPCNLMLPDSASGDTLRADSTSSVVTIDSSMIESGKLIVRYRIEAKFEMPIIE